MKHALLPIKICNIPEELGLCLVWSVLWWKILFKVEGARLTTSNCKVLPTKLQENQFFVHFFFLKCLTWKIKKWNYSFWNLFQSVHKWSFRVLECAANKLKDPSLSWLLQKILNNTANIYRGNCDTRKKVYKSRFYNKPM